MLLPYYLGALALVLCHVECLMCRPFSCRIKVVSACVGDKGCRHASGVEVEVGEIQPAISTSLEQ